MSADQIIIEGIEVMAHVGVPDEERAKAQKLEISLILYLNLAKAGHTDDLKQTIDYFSVQQRVIQIVQQKPRKLIETLAEDLASTVLKEFGAKEIQIEVKKFILEKTKSVAVRIIREA
jgi:dihydroneopterin aldolase